MNKFKFILITDIINTENLLKKGYSELASVWKRHETLVLPLINYFKGEVLHQSSGNIFATFTNGVTASLCGIKIQEAHHIWKEGLPPPAIRVIVLKVPLNITQSREIMDYFSKNKINVFFSIGGQGEILLDEEVSKLWEEYGNRDLREEVRIAEVENNKYIFKLINLSTHTKEPFNIIKKRGWLYISILLIPAFIITLLNFKLLNKPQKKFHSPALLVGAFHNNFFDFGCSQFYEFIHTNNNSNFKVINFCNKTIYSHTIPEGSLLITGSIARVHQEYKIQIYLTNLNTGILITKKTKKFITKQELKTTLLQIINSIIKQL